MTDVTKQEAKPYPVYCETDEDLPPGLYLALFHGFEDEKARLENNEAGGGWGANGPVIGPLRHVQTTYMTHIKFEFVERAAQRSTDWTRASRNCTSTGSRSASASAAWSMATGRSTSCPE